MSEDKKDKFEWLDFLKLWVSVVAGGLTSLYISRVYGNDEDILNNLSWNTFLDISGHGLMYIIIIVFGFLIVYLGWNLFINLLKISFRFIFGPLTCLNETLIKYGLKKPNPPEEKETNWYNDEFMPKINRNNFIISIIIMFIIYSNLDKILLKLDIIHTIILITITIIYSLFYLILYWKKGH